MTQRYRIEIDRPEEGADGFASAGLPWRAVVSNGLPYSHPDHRSRSDWFATRTEARDWAKKVVQMESSR